MISEFGARKLGSFRHEGLQDFLIPRGCPRPNTRGMNPEQVNLLFSAVDLPELLIANLAVMRLGQDARHDAELLGEAISRAVADTFRVWANDDGMSADSIVDAAAAKLQVLRGFLAQA